MKKIFNQFLLTFLVFLSVCASNAYASFTVTNYKEHGNNDEYALVIYRVVNSSYETIITYDGGKWNFKLESSITIPYNTTQTDFQIESDSKYVIVVSNSKGTNKIEIYNPKGCVVNAHYESWIPTLEVADHFLGSCGL